jgi:hypothetical protein
VWKAAQKPTQIAEGARPVPAIRVGLANVDTESARIFHASSLFGHFLPTILKIVT